jgi:alpha-mannosidase
MLSSLSIMPGMSLSTEWGRRLDNWRREISNLFYRPLGEIAFGGFTTGEHLSFEEARNRSFPAMPAGSGWGAMWEYGWFSAAFTLPREASRKRMVIRPDFGAEALVFINGTARGAVDAEHREIMLTRSGKPGARFDILAEAYAGHGPVKRGPEPNQPHRPSPSEPGTTLAVLGRSTFGIWEEEVYQLAMDAETLFMLRNALDPDSLRVSRIDDGLKDFTTTVDFELPHEEFVESVRKCRKRLAPLLSCANGPSSPTLFAFGHAHIDVAWLWPLAETERKVGRTFATQLSLLEEYPGFRFLQSTPKLYLMAKERYPELYSRVRKAVKEGRFIAEGGMWVEADTNITGGESLIRQLLYGIRFFREELGVESRILWLPDVFGYSGAMPQIMRGCGIRFFSTAKILWAYNGGDPFPYVSFRWQGIDGSEVLAHLCCDYSSPSDPSVAVHKWNERAQKDGISARLFPFGHGDGGGGPTRDHLEYLSRLSDLEGAPRVKMAHPLEFFDELERSAPQLPRYVGELYYQAHRGTYTSQARTKRANRKNEAALREAELWAALSHAITGFKIPTAELEEAWRLLLLNQFHDIIPGSSIARVYEEALADHEKVRLSTSRVTSAAVLKIVKRGGSSLTVFNSLGWPRTELIDLPGRYEAARDSSGRELPQQEIDGKTWVEVDVPACGWASITLGEPVKSGRTGSGAWRAAKAARSGAPPAGAAAGKPGAQPAVAASASADRGLLENGLLRVRFNGRGEITGILDKEADRELAAGACNSFTMYRDVPTAWDAWDIDSMYPLVPVALGEKARFDVLDRGPLIARLRISRRIHLSDITQIVSLRRGSRRVDFDTTVEWRESHKMLKVCFPVGYHADEALHEIQFGHVRRPTHYSRPFDGDRFEVSAHRWSALAEEGRGFALLNDCKYGINVLGNSMNLTLLRSPNAPDPLADRGTQRFLYAFYSWNRSLAEGGLVREGYRLNQPVWAVGGNGGERSLLGMDAPNVVLETVKPPEPTGKDDGNVIVVRLYEAMRTATRCSLSVDLPVEAAAEADMRETELKALVARNGKILLDFKPFEIKTVVIRLAGAVGSKRRHAEGSMESSS